MVRRADLGSNKSRTDKKIIPPADRSKSAPKSKPLTSPLVKLALTRLVRELQTKPTQPKPKMQITKTLTLIAAIAAVTINTSHARIGETMEQAIKRYGNPFPRETADEWTTFRKGIFIINVQFHQDKIDVVEYLKLEERTAELSEVEIKNFLKANYNGSWKEVRRNFWQVSNLNATHNFVTIKGDPSNSYYRLLIMTDDSVDRAMKQIETEETAAQAGF
jgi:hypothetical protein